MQSKLNDPSTDDGIKNYLNKVCLYNVAGVAVAMTGRLVEVGPIYVTFERKDGRKAQVKRSAITTIEEVR